MKKPLERCKKHRRTSSLRSESVEKCEYANCRRYARRYIKSAKTWYCEAHFAKIAQHFETMRNKSKMRKKISVATLKYHETARTSHSRKKSTRSTSDKLRRHKR